MNTTDPLASAITEILKQMPTTVLVALLLLRLYGDVVRLLEALFKFAQSELSDWSKLARKTLDAPESTPNDSNPPNSP